MLKERGRKDLAVLVCLGRFVASGLPLLAQQSRQRGSSAAALVLRSDAAPTALASLYSSRLAKPEPFAFAGWTWLTGSSSKSCALLCHDSDYL